MDIATAEIKAEGDDEMTFKGYGAAFNNRDSYGDVIAPGAFKAFLDRMVKGKEKWPVMLSQHGGWAITSTDLTPVGVWTDMHEDSKGLPMEGKLAPTPRGQELYTLMKMTPRPAIDGLSIGYIAKKWEMSKDPKKDEYRRKLTEIDLMETSIVTFPANTRARVTGVKSLRTIREFEDFLRDVGGFSRSEAKAIASAGYSAVGDLRDEDADAEQVLQTLRSNIAIFTGV